jgi:hypothetical protein
MKKATSLITAAMLLVATAAPASALPLAVQPAAPAATEIIQVQGNCNVVGQQVAAQNGGTLASASAQNMGGQTVCHIVVLVPAKDGQRPRRVEVTVPLS